MECISRFPIFKKENYGKKEEKRYRLSDSCERSQKRTPGSGIYLRDSGNYFCGKRTYSFGYLVFDQHPMAATEEEGQDVTVVIKEEDSVYQVGKVLESKGLIERSDIFWVQEKLSDHQRKDSAGHVSSEYLSDDGRDVGDPVRRKYRRTALPGRTDRAG